LDQEALLREVAEEMLLREAGKRRFIYNDVEDLIDNDFLTHTLMIEGVQVVLRSLLPEDTKRLRARTSRASAHGEISRWMLATSTWMVGGFELSSDPKDNAPWHVYQDLYRDMPDSLVMSMVSVVVGFQNRISRAARLVEAYCYESYSRSSWRMSGKAVGPNTNVVKRLWAAYNTTEDMSHDEDMQWRYTQTIVASMTNKGGKEIGKSLDKSAEKETTRQRKVIEDAVNWVINGEKSVQPKIKIMVDGKEFAVDRIQIAETFEELEDDMRRALAGEQDFHDTMVSQYHEGIRKRTEEARQARADRVQAARDAYVERDAGPNALVGYTEEQLRALRPDVLEQKKTGTMGADPTAGRIYNRYFQQTIRPGVIDQHGNVKPSDRVAPTEEEASPEPTLEERLEARKPILR
jgi:hypothetical protein